MGIFNPEKTTLYFAVRPVHLNVFIFDEEENEYVSLQGIHRYAHTKICTHQRKASRFSTFSVIPSQNNLSSIMSTHKAVHLEFLPGHELLISIYDGNNHALIKRQANDVFIPRGFAGDNFFAHVEFRGEMRLEHPKNPSSRRLHCFNFNLNQHFLEEVFSMESAIDEADLERNWLPINLMMGNDFYGSKQGQLIVSGGVPLVL